MTLAALSPLFIWWPISFATLALIVTAARRLWPPQLPAPLQMATFVEAVDPFPYRSGGYIFHMGAWYTPSQLGLPDNDWPPPTVWPDAALDRLLAAVQADPWGAPDPWTRAA